MNDLIDRIHLYSSPCAKFYMYKGVNAILYRRVCLQFQSFKGRNYKKRLYFLLAFSASSQARTLPTCVCSSANLSHVNSISTLGRLQSLQDSSTNFSCRLIMEVFFSIRVLSLSSSSSLPPPIPRKSASFSSVCRLR